MAKLYDLQQTDAAPAFDPSKRFVRERGERPDGFVEFDFAIGDPELSVELILPRAAFDEFCSVNHVIRITDAQALQLDLEREKWSKGRPGGDRDPADA